MGNLERRGRSYPPSGPEPTLASAAIALPLESSFLPSVLSLSLSVQAGSVSTGIKFSKTLLISCAIHEGLSCKTRESSRSFLDNLISPFLASADMVELVHRSHGPALYQQLSSHTLGVLSRACFLIFCNMISLRIF